MSWRNLIKVEWFTRLSQSMWISSFQSLYGNARKVSCELSLTWKYRKNHRSVFEYSQCSSSVWRSISSGQKRISNAANFVLENVFQIESKLHGFLFLLLLLLFSRNTIDVSWEWKIHKFCSSVVEKLKLEEKFENHARCGRRDNLKLIDVSDVKSRFRGGKLMVKVNGGSSDVSYAMWVMRRRGWIKSFSDLKPSSFVRIWTRKHSIVLKQCHHM